MNAPVGAALALSVFAKVWPLVVAPTMLLRRQWRGLTAWAITGAAALAGWVTWAGPTGSARSSRSAGASGWQIESIPGIVLHALDPDGSTVQQGAWRTAVASPRRGPHGSEPRRPRRRRPGVVVGRHAVRPAGARDRAPNSGHGPDGAIDLVVEGLAPLAAVVALLVFSSIISPQYVLWFLPFAALVTAPR